ncbi:MAG: hypothetical protein LBQ66_08600 [Planctomycetaceae bacterium]|nr:hypothetical protein [Planctomycetaceae bacterium]
MGNRLPDGNVRWVTDRWAVTFSASGASRKQWIAKTHRQRKVGNRPLGGCVASESLSQADSGIAKTHRKNQNALRFGHLGFGR